MLLQNFQLKRKFFRWKKELLTEKIIFQPKWGIFRAKEENLAKKKGSNLSYNHSQTRRRLGASKSIFGTPIFCQCYLLVLLFFVSLFFSTAIFCVPIFCYRNFLLPLFHFSVPLFFGTPSAEQIRRSEEQVRRYVETLYRSAKKHSSITEKFWSSDRA